MPLSGVTIIIEELQTGAITDVNGKYSIRLPQGNYNLTVTYLGYLQQSQEIILNEHTTLNFKLKQRSENLGEILLYNRKSALNPRSPQMSITSIDAGTIKDIPAVLGEADLLSALVLLPGVSTGGEGSSGFNVRGGATDQNLILLDNAQLFNASHLLGLFSVFNPDAIRHADLYKGGIPARFGGRVSSVLDIEQRPGNYQDFKVTGGIGAVSSKLLLEGPIEKDKLSFSVGGRASYAHLFLPLFDVDNSASFYDFNTKWNYRLSGSDIFSFTGYIGRDAFSISDSFSNDYGNLLGTLNWKHRFSEKLSSKLSLIYSDYSFDLDLDFASFKYDTGIENYTLQYDLDHTVDQNIKLTYGLSGIQYVFNPGFIQPNNANSGIQTEQLAKKYAREFALYAEVEHELDRHWNFRYGLRLSHFIRQGQDGLFIYENDEPLLFNEVLDIYSPAEAIGSFNLDRNSIIRSFTFPEPRLAASYLFDDDKSIKLSYNRMVQYIHLISNTNAPTPLDVYTPSGKYIDPQLLDQYAIGYTMNTADADYSLLVETFYKDVQNRLDYRNGAQLIATRAVEQEILAGKSRAYGLEVLLKKNSGALTGWLAYTLSRSEQQTPGRSPVENGINNGNWYPTAYDRTHDLSINTSFQHSLKWRFNANFIYQTGRPTNYPVSQSLFQGLTVANFGPRNAQRLPAYHRLDVSATLTPENNENTKIKTEWVFSIYNLYNRRNAASINFERDINTGNNQALRTSIFGIIPSVSLNFKF